MNDEPDKLDKLEPDQLPVLAPGTGVALQRAEIDLQIATAKAHPRSLKGVAKNIFDLATIDGATAAKGIYALPPRAGSGRAIKGPSIRFAEIVYQQYGNCRAKAWVDHVDRNEKVVYAKAIFQDLENNTAVEIEEPRRIVDKYGKLYSEDMIITSSKAAMAIARRNAILAGVPEQVYASAFAEAQRIIAGDVKSLPERRANAVKAFAHFGIKPEQIAAALGLESMEEITGEHLTTLQGMHSALRSGESTVEEMFGADKKAPADNWKPPEEIKKEPAHDPQTGELKEEEPSKPRKLDFIVKDNVVENYIQWAQRFIAEMEKETKDAAAQQWMDLNAATLNDIAKENKKLDARIHQAVAIKRAALRTAEAKS